ncbi:MAG: Gfo/Idh/MocA family oxidoreductase [Chloroflexi bacterium]|nr:Gfo/Idh/MocA family oxidoreductase [Chloroflexota bacterium]MCY3938363.1 Gfo/Idh/MocA family oxidoreductase [Chloroflexota bacterium]
MSDIRCGLIGYSLGWEQHGRRHGTYINSTDGMKLAAVCDINPEARSKARSDFPGVETYKTPDDLLDDGDIDLVSILTPHHLHFPLALAALEAGKHVVVEKPMCFTVEQADTLFETADTRGGTVTTFFNRRRDGNFLAIEEIVRLGEIGDLRDVRLVSESRGLHENHWRNVKSRSGGLLYNSLGAHAFDWVLRLLAGQRVLNVVGVAVPAQERDLNELHTRAWLRFDSGALADVTISRMSLTGQPLWQISGTEGTIIDTGKNATANYLYPFPVTAEAPGSFMVRKLEDGQVGERVVKYSDSAWGKYYSDLASHLAGDGPEPVTSRDSRRVVAVMEAVEESVRSGSPELVDGE